MADLGRYNLLEIKRYTDFGVYVDGRGLGEILVPKRYVPSDFRVGDKLKVFVYLDSDERCIATTEKVLATVGEAAYMQIVSVSNHGAFAKWGLKKDLFIPFREQLTPVEEGSWYMIYVFIDELSERITGSTKIENYIDQDSEGFQEKSQVNAVVYRTTPSGYLCIVENQCFGMLYENEVYKNISVGDHITPFIKKIREDSKLDLTLQEEGYGSVRDFSDDLLDYLVKHRSVELHDKSDPNDIYKTFGVSKKIFKKAVGKLYKEKKIVLGEGKISIV